MNILVLQHEKVEHPGIFREFLAEDGHSWTAIELNEGELLPSSLDGYDALWVLGGPMDVWQEKEHPWFCLLYTSPSPRDGLLSRMPSSA